MMRVQKCRGAAVGRGSRMAAIEGRDLYQGLAILSNTVFHSEGSDDSQQNLTTTQNQQDFAALKCGVTAR